MLLFPIFPFLLCFSHHYMRKLIIFADTRFLTCFGRYIITFSAAYFFIRNAQFFHNCTFCVELHIENTLHPSMMHDGMFMHAV